MLIMENKPVEEEDLHQVETACDILATFDSAIASVFIYLDSSSFVVALGHIYSIMRFTIASHRYAKDLGSELAAFSHESKCKICDVAQSHFNAHQSPLLAIVKIAMGLQAGNPQ